MTFTNGQSGNGCPRTGRTRPRCGGGSFPARAQSTACSRCLEALHAGICRRPCARREGPVTGLVCRPGTFFLFYQIQQFFIGCQFRCVEIVKAANGFKKKIKSSRLAQSASWVVLFKRMSTTRLTPAVSSLEKKMLRGFAGKSDGKQYHGRPPHISSRFSCLTI